MIQCSSQWFCTTLLVLELIVMMSAVPGSKRMLDAVSSVLRSGMTIELMW